MLVVADTNVFVRALFLKDDWCGKVLRLESEKTIQFAMNEDTYLELCLVIAEFLIKEDKSRFLRIYNKFMNVLWRIVKIPHQTYSNLSADPGDNKFIDCAIDGECPYIITYDGSHLFGLEPKIKKEYGKLIKILSPYQFFVEISSLKLQQIINARRL
ncbi:MAG: putative toxin-antitoxin system toxin component, PIN family [Firmicutes bacterium]|nr:putative toxin-antitoxin system toxin component, PIN family [Bacillota bacterium]